MEDQEQQRYDRAHARVQAIKGFYVHASVFVLVNIGLFVINALTSGLAGGGMVVLLASPGLGHRLGSTRSGRLRLRWGRTLGPGLGGTQDQGDDGRGRRIMRKRTVMQKNHPASGRQVAFERVAIGRMASGAGVRGRCGGSGRVRELWRSAP